MTNDILTKLKTIAEAVNRTYESTTCWDVKIKVAKADNNYKIAFQPSTVLALLELIDAYQECIEFEYPDYRDAPLGKNEQDILERIKKGAGL